MKNKKAKKIWYKILQSFHIEWTSKIQYFCKGEDMKKKKVVALALVLLMIVLLAGCFGQTFVQKYKTNITEYKIDFVLADDHTIAGNQTVNYKNSTSNILNEVYFHLYPNSFSATAENKPVSTLYESKAYPNGKSYGSISMEDVNIQNNDCSFSLEGTDDDILKVMLNAPLYPNDFVSIQMKYKIKIPNVLHRFGYNEKTINLGNIYPIACVFDENGWDKNPYNANGDPFYSNLANYSINITYPKDYVLASSGEQTAQAKNENNLTSKIYAPAVRDFAMVLSKNFETKIATCGDTKIQYYFYDDENADASLETAKKALLTFEDTFGKYPYSTLAIVKTGFLYGGMEYPNLVMISDNLGKYEDFTNTIVHEVAHQWWYGLVGNNQFDHGWMDESLAEYSTVIFYEKNPEYNIKRDVCIKNAITSYTMFVDVFEDVFKKVDTSMDRPLDKFATEPEYVYAAYVRGMIMFDDIRNLIGDRTFFRCLKNYCSKYKGQNALPENMISVFENTSGKKLKPLFLSYIDGTAIIGEIKSQKTEK